MSNIDLKQSQIELENLRFALDQSSIVAMTDPQGSITYVNDLFCKISGFSSEELLGKNHRIVKSGHHPAEFFDTMWQTISSGKVWQAEVKNRAKNGSYYWVDTTIVPLLNEQGQIDHYIAIRNDITEKKKVQEELRMFSMALEEQVKARTKELETAVHELEELQQSQEIYVTAMTHDLRTPLVAQERVLEIFSRYKDKLPEDFRPMADGMQKSNQDLLALVNKLLDIYQFESGQIELEMQKSDISKLLQSCSDDMQVLANNKNITLKVQAAKTPLELMIDRDLIRRVIINLLSNAIESIPEKCTIKLKCLQKNETVIVEIQDNGPGIPEEIRANLFDRYHNAKLKKKKLGSGLGLSICKMIMDLHKADIILESDANTGTTFKLVFQYKGL